MVKNRKNSSARKYVYTAISALIVGVGSAYFVSKFVNPPYLPNIRTTVDRYYGNSEEKVIENPYLLVSISNNGNNYAENLRVEFSLPNGLNILGTERSYDPPSLKKSVRAAEEKANLFYEELSSLPSESNIEYRFYIENFANSRDEFGLHVCSK